MPRKSKKNITLNIEEVNGNGLVKDIKKLGKKSLKQLQSTVSQGEDIAQQAINKTKKYVKAVVYGRNDYPPKVRDLLKKYGQEVVSGLTIKRTPVNKLLTGALSLFSLGKFGKRMERSFDELFHLYLEIKTQSGKLLSVEKNEVIDMNLNPPTREKTESKEVKNNLPQNLTIQEMLDKTKDLMGTEKYFAYSAIDDNCQDFITAIFRANKMGDESDITFIKQDTKKLFKDLPYLSKFTNAITDLGAKVNVITQGAGLDILHNYSSVLEHLMSHITDVNEPIDPRDYKQAIQLIKAIEKEKKKPKMEGNGLNDYVVQSVIFSTDKWKTPKAKKWLKEHDYKIPKVDKKEEHLRFRQVEPSEVEEKGYTEYRTKELGEDSGIALILVYRKNKISRKNIMPRKMKGEGAIPTQILVERGGFQPSRALGGAICTICKHKIETKNADGDSSDDEMEGGKLNIGKEIKKAVRKAVKPAEKLAVSSGDKVADYVTSKKGGLATDLVKYAIPAASSAVLGAAATAATGGNPVAGVAGSALGAKLGTMASKEVQKASGTGMRKARFEKGSEEAKEHMRKIREMRKKK